MSSAWFDAWDALRTARQAAKLAKVAKPEDGNGTQVHEAAYRRSGLATLAGLAADHRKDCTGTTPTDPPSWVWHFELLDYGTPPSSVTDPDWRQLIEAGRIFIANGWPVRAASLGWTARDLIGCDLRAPVARLDRAGLIWLLGDGHRVVAMTADHAVIASSSGQYLRFYRRERGSGRIMPWDLR